MTAQGEGKGMDKRKLLNRLDDENIDRWDSLAREVKRDEQAYGELKRTASSTHGEEKQGLLDRLEKAAVALRLKYDRLDAIWERGKREEHLLEREQE